jgi:hypothetical protein
MSKKRTNDNDNNSNYNSRKRTKIIDMNEIANNTNSILDKLKSLGTQIQETAIVDRSTVDDVRSKYNTIKEQLENEFNNIVSITEQQISANQQEREIQEREGMGNQEYVQYQDLRKDFLSKLDKITNNISKQLTYGEQVEVYNAVLIRLNDILVTGHPKLRDEPNQLNRLRNLTTVITNWAMDQISITLTNIYTSSPTITRQFIAILSATTMIYNYLPSGLRGAFANIPYFGPLFNILNTLNPQTVIVQNTFATVTSIYYLLRNAGIETQQTIDALSESVTNISRACGNQMGQFICTNVSSAYNGLQTGYANIIETLGERLGDLLASQYQNLNNINFDETPSPLEESQNSVFSDITGLNNSIASRRSVNVNNLPESVISHTSQVSVQSVNQLLRTPIEEGGIDVGNMVPEQIINERMQEIINVIVEQQPVTNNPIIASPIQQADSTTVSRVIDIDNYSNSSSSQSSISSVSVQDSWFYWLFGNIGRGGRKRRQGKGKSRKTKRKYKLSKRKSKSKSNKKSRKTRKIKRKRN